MQMHMAAYDHESPTPDPWHGLGLPAPELSHATSKQARGASAAATLAKDPESSAASTQVHSSAALTDSMDGRDSSLDEFDVRCRSPLASVLPVSSGTENHGGVHDREERRPPPLHDAFGGAATLGNGGVRAVLDHGRALVMQHALDGDFQIIDLGRLTRLYDAFLEAMPSVRPHYAVKCNPHCGLVQALADLGCGFDCASGPEIRSALAAGAPASSIILANTCKCPADLRVAASAGVSRMTFDCEDELDKIAEMAPHAQLVLRIRADDLTALLPLGDKFGADAVTEAPKLLAAAAQRNLTVIGVSFHVGSGSQDAEAYRAAIRAARGVFDVAAAAGADMWLLDIGGGFYGRFGSDGTVELEEVASVVNGALRDFFPPQQFRNLEVIAEPGRFFAETCVTIFSMVHTVRTRLDGRRAYYSTDGLYGSHADLPRGLNHARTHIMRSPALPPPKLHEVSALVRSDVFGPTCDSWDCLLADVPMPLLRRGDWLQFPEHGAYSTSMSATFNGFSVAAARTFYVRSRHPVDSNEGPAKKVVTRGTSEGTLLWPWQESDLCLVATREDLLCKVPH